jgi:hypothetical protein
VAYNPRPFAGRAAEGDLVALREVVPTATAPLRLLEDPAGRTVTLATVLPMAWPALVRRDGAIVLALQCPARSGDLGMDLGQALTIALDTEPGNGVSGLVPAEPGTPSLFDLVVDEDLQVSIRDGFDWWITEEDREAGLDQEVLDSLTRANAAVVPTVRLQGVPSAYWCRVGPTRTHLRWALTGAEDALSDALARMLVDGGLGLGDGTRYVGAFRAHGVLMPVWDLRDDEQAEDVQAPALHWHQRLQAALADDSPLTGEQRRVRAGVLSRQLTLR